MRLSAIILAMCALCGFSPAAMAAQIEVEKVEGEDFVIIGISGEITKGDEDKFRRAALENPRAIVWLNSPGGALSPALSIGRIIRISEFPTVVDSGSVCASSCALIWLAGSTRLLSRTGRVGFHASYYEEDGQLIETGVGNAIVGHYLSQLSLPEKAVVFATSASPSSITWLNRENMQASGISFQPLEKDAPPADAVSAPRRGSLDELFTFTNAATCDMSTAMLSTFQGLVIIDETTWEARQGRRIQLPGADRPIAPTFSRNRESGGGYDAREVLATLPVNADWLGLPVDEIQYVFFEQSSNYEYRIFFDAPARQVRNTLNKHGFDLPEVGTPKTFDPPTSPRYGMAVLEAERGSVWICGSRMFY